MMKSSMRHLGAYFNTNRMLQEYTGTFYVPAHRAGERWRAVGMEGARDLATWREKVRAAWGGVSVRVVDWREREVAVGTVLDLTLKADLGTLGPDDVAVEVLCGPLDTAGEIRDGRVFRAVHVKADRKQHVFHAEVPCASSGRQGFAARILPRHPSEVNPLTPLMLTWE
jgi:starch phosphorylase